MRWFSCLALGLLIVTSVGAPALARVALIQTMAPLQDHTAHSIRAALEEKLTIRP